jgi:hypothetical protein
MRIVAHPLDCSQEAKGGKLPGGGWFGWSGAAEQDHHGFLRAFLCDTPKWFSHHRTDKPHPKPINVPGRRSNSVVKE